MLFGSCLSVALLRNLADFATEIHFSREKPGGTRIHGFGRTRVQGTGYCYIVPHYPQSSHHHDHDHANKQTLSKLETANCKITTTATAAAATATATTTTTSSSTSSTTTTSSSTSTKKDTLQ